jgi:ABC-type lipoprotein export system ATPase subunit
MQLFTELNREGTTIIQVSHSMENARFGTRIIELRDGWMTPEASA